MIRLGVHLTAAGAEVAVFSSHATAIEFCLFTQEGEHRTLLQRGIGDIHHATIAGLRPGDRYGLRAHGQALNPDHLLIDPYATLLDSAPRLHQSMLPGGTGDNADFVPKAIITAPEQHTPRPLHPWSQTVLYELHVRGFSMLNPAIPEAIRGTFAALAHPASLAHLTSLGITAVELLPVCAGIEERHLFALGLENHWGYNPIALLAPDPRLAPGGWPEIRSAVAALEAAGIETILDVVLNHTGEGDALGPTLSLRGLDPHAYYRYAGDSLINDTGCGNTLACDHPAMLALAMDCLRSWARHAGVHGFRFDLATTMARRADGFDPHAPLLQAIAQDELLGGLKMIAEPWDIGPGGYQLGRFPALWAEWNDRSRDDIRRFWRGCGTPGALATRLAGSQDVFAARLPSRSINFITAHDGFTLADLTAFTEKRNEANGEQNRDGTNENFSWNCGTEGPTDNPQIRARRAGDQRALLATLLLARGTPMLAMGSETGHSQQGNNNAYAQNNATTWLDWTKTDPDLLAWTRRLLALRKAHPDFVADQFLAESDVLWQGANGAPDWHAGDVLSLQIGMLRLVLNRGPAPCAIEGAWTILADSAAPLAPPAYAEQVMVAPRAVLLLQEPLSGRRSTKSEIDTLAKAAGIAPDWWEVDGTHHQVSPDTLRALLAAMGLDADTRSSTRDSLAAITAPRPLPQALVRRISQPLTLAAPLRRGLAPRTVFVHVQEDSGALHHLRLPWQDGVITLPALGLGRHRIWRDDAPECVCGVTIAPDACFLPDALLRGQRRFGIAAQLYTLRRRHDPGIGDLTTLRALCRVAATSGAAIVGINPLHALFPNDRRRASPYYPSDRRFIDPLYLDLGAPEAPATAMVDYPALWAAQRARLEGLTPRREMADFITEGGETLRRFAVFEAISDQRGPSWQSWPHALQNPESAEVAAFATAHAGRVAFHQAVQALCDSQLHDAVSQSGLEFGLLRDLAIGCAPDGAEAWAMGSRLAQTASIGSPPDPFSREGQIWGLPPPVPHRMSEGGYAAFADLLRTNLRHAGGLRIDHVMGLARLFWVPAGGQGRDGAYVKMPFADLLGEIALASHHAGAFIVGEDLGTVPEGFRETLTQQQMLSYRVLFLEREGEAFRPAESYPARAMASVSTHDLPTFTGWLHGADLDERVKLGQPLAEGAKDQHAREQRAHERVALKAALGEAKESSADLLVAAHGFVARSPCALMMVQADDLVAETMAVNLPGTDTERPNWRRRLVPEIETLLQSEPAASVLSAIQPGRLR